MEPVKRIHHNKVYKGNGPGVGDLSGYAAEGQFSSHWRPNSEEIAVLVEGGDIEVTVFQEPIPPLGVGVIASEADGSSLPADPESQEVVETAGHEWRVPPMIAHELNQHREGLAEKIIATVRQKEVKENETVIVTVPDDVSPEVTAAILNALKGVFPDNRSAVFPESMGLHTKEKFVELMEAGAEMARLIGQGRGGDAHAAAKRWNELV